MKLNGLENYFITNEINEIIDFTQVNEINLSPLLFILENNKKENLNLNEKQLNFLIKNSNLKQTDNYSISALMYLFSFNKNQKINLSNKLLNYILKNSDLKHVNYYGWNSLRYALVNSKDLNLTKEQWKYIIDNSNLSLITEKEHLMELKKIQSELFNEEILNKIGIKENLYKKNKI